MATVVHGASALYLKDAAGHQWLTKWSPEKKLARLVTNGDLEGARLFAEYHKICDESIVQSELTCLVANNEKLERISELLDQIHDQSFLIDFALKLSGVSDAEKIVMEHLDTIQMDDYVFEMYQNQETIQTGTDWKSMIISGLQTSQYQLCKAEIIAHIGQMDESFMLEIVQNIPNHINCHDLYDFFDELLGVLLGRFPTKIRQLMPHWLVGRITAFENDVTAWPKKCLELIDMVEKTLTYSSDSIKFSRVSHSRNGIKVLQTMKNQLSTLAELKEKYAISVTFDDFNTLLLSPIWQLGLVRSKISTAKPNEIEALLNKFVTPFLLANCQNADGLLIEGNLVIILVPLFIETVFF